MLKNPLKKLLAMTVFAVMLLPSPVVQAAEVSITSDQVIDNLTSVESVDFSLDLDVETDSAELDQPVKFHLDLDGESDFAYNAAYDVGFWSTDEFGVYQEMEGSLLVTPELAYISDNGEDWYFLEYAASTDVPTEAEIEDFNDGFKDIVQDLFDQGVIEYDLETVEIVSGELTVRYAYEIDNDRLVDYLVAEGLVASDEAEEIRVALSEAVTMSGYLWVSITDLLPVMYTLDIAIEPDETTYTNIALAIVFNDFNEQVVIDEPANAVSIDEYVMDDSLEFTLANLETSAANAEVDADTDNDGLTDSVETSTWYSNPYSVDSDADGYLDLTEVVNGYDPNGPGKLDSDLDGLTDYSEMNLYGSDRFDADTDNDGYADGLEIANGYSPLGVGRL
jgi:hypothetical protein